MEFLPTEVPGKEWFYWGVDHIPGALRVHGTSPRGGILVNKQVLVDWYGKP